MRRYLRYFLVPILVGVGAVVAATSYLGWLSGDLTRLGGFSERDFGWHSTQPVIHVLANGERVAHPDVLVLGDSFSEGNLWQSVMSAGSGHTTLTYAYHEINCPSSWLDYALARPGANTVIVETVERAFIKRYAKLERCRPERLVPTWVAASRTDATRNIWPLLLYPHYTYKTALNRYTMRHVQGRFKSGLVINTPIKPGCAAFSNRRTDRMLYFLVDDFKLKWTSQELADAVANVKKIQDEFAAHGKKFIFVLVPDKSSVYRDCLVDDADNAARKRINTTQALLAAGVNTPDLMGVFQRNANRIIDLYLPDDTHVSSSGFILMGHQIAPLLPQTAYAAR